MARRFLVTGCAGFIGCEVTRQLLARGDEVVGVDNLNDAYDPRLKRWRLGQLTGQAGFRFFEADITDREAMEKLFAGEGNAARPPFTAVVNLAARAGVQPSVDNPWVYFSANLEGVLNLLDECRRCGVGKFLLASTSSLYGAHNETPYREDADTNRPLSPYAASKKAAEALCHSYHHLHGLDVAIPRFFTVYGPAGRPDMSIFRFVRRISEGEPILVTGDGGQKRDFTYVEDVARGVVAALDVPGYEIINLGGDRSVRLMDVINKIGELVGRRPQIDYRPTHRADVPATWADIDKARALLGWSPQVSLEQGLERTITWYREHREMARELVLGDY